MTDAKKKKEENPPSPEETPLGGGLERAFRKLIHEKGPAYPGGKEPGKKEKGGRD